MDERTGRIDKEKIAADLEMGDLGREAAETTYRKLGMALVERLWEGEEIPEHLPMPFWNLRVIMDELESQMATTEWLSASPELQQGFVDFWNRCRQILLEASARRAQSMEQSQTSSAVAQATQQAAAKAAAETVDQAMEQIRAAEQVAPQAPAQVMEAFAQQRQGPQ